MNGRAYHDDPTIMSWQLANEPRPGQRRRTRQPHFEAFVKWIDETAGFIKKLAPKQLVSTGNEGWMGTAGNRELYVKSHATKNVDYLTFHMWAPNWSWFDPKKPRQTYDGAWTKMQDYLNWHIDTANKMGKPIVLEEFGINRDGGSFNAGRHARSIATGSTAAVYGLLARRAAAGDAIAGSNFWAWGGAGRTQQRGFHVEGRATVSSAIRRRSRRGSTACSIRTPRRSRSSPAHARQMSEMQAESGLAGAPARAGSRLPVQRSIMARSAVSENGLAR